MIEEQLDSLGLSKNEVAVYICILKNGRCNGSKIRKLTGIANSRVYAAIDKLIEKGIITYAKVPSGRLYSALDPSVLGEISREKQRRIEEAIPLLKEIQKNTSSQTETAIYEGFQGFRTALMKFANDCPKNECVYIIGFSNQAYKNEKLAAVLRDTNKIAMKKKHKFKMILDNRENQFFNERKGEKISEIKFMENGFRSPAAIDIYGDWVYILLWDEEPYAFVIKNKNVAEGFKVYFEFLWGMAKN